MHMVSQLQDKVAQGAGVVPFISHMSLTVLKGACKHTRPGSHHTRGTPHCHKLVMHACLMDMLRGRLTRAEDASLFASSLATRVWAATARPSARSEAASHTCRQIWCPAACATSLRAAMAVARANTAVMAVVRNTSRPAQCQRHSVYTCHDLEVNVLSSGCHRHSGRSTSSKPWHASKTARGHSPAPGNRVVCDASVNFAERCKACTWPL